MPRYRLPDGTIHHSRSLSHVFGTHSLQHFQAHGVKVELVAQAPKFVYVALVDSSWRDRLKLPVQEYLKPEVKNEGN